MKTSYQANWEDEENNRHVELVVNYQLDKSRVDICDVTPIRVTLTCPESGKPLRSINVRSAAGRNLLARQIEAAGRLATLPQEIAEGRLVEIKHPQTAATTEATPVLQA
jgi:hypothetical protein